MSITALSGPFIQYGITLSSTSGDGITGQDLEHNPTRAPSMCDLGDAMLDPRSAYNYDPGGAQSPVGFYSGFGVVDYVPVTVNTSALVSNTGSSGVSTFTLQSSVGIATTIIAPETGKVTGTLIALDSTAIFLTMGVSPTQALLWNPGAGTGRNITIHPSSNLDGGTYSIAGRDMYGYKMTETIAGGSTSLAGKKAFKFISSITNCTTPTSTGISIGFGDLYGFPLKVPYAGLNVQVAVNSTNAVSAIVPLSATNTVVASTVATQTSTTPDVRGTFSSTTASNGAERIQMQVTPCASAIAVVTATDVSALFGGTQFSSV